jgi:hypothetical protein
MRSVSKQQNEFPIFGSKSKELDDFGCRPMDMTGVVVGTRKEHKSLIDRC